MTVIRMVKLTTYPGGLPKVSWLASLGDFLLVTRGPTFFEALGALVAIMNGLTFTIQGRVPLEEDEVVPTVIGDGLLEGFVNLAPTRLIASTFLELVETDISLFNLVDLGKKYYELASISIEAKVVVEEMEWTERFTREVQDEDLV